MAVGMYGARVALDTRLSDGDRVEIYRPLQADPKDLRRRRACRGERGLTWLAGPGMVASR